MRPEKKEAQHGWRGALVEWAAGFGRKHEMGESWRDTSSRLDEAGRNRSQPSAWRATFQTVQTLVSGKQMDVGSSPRIVSLHPWHGSQRDCDLS